jgi:hypothetical protein
MQREIDSDTAVAIRTEERFQPVIAADDPVLVNVRAVAIDANRAARQRRPRLRLSQLGFNRLGLVLLMLDGAVFLGDVALFRSRLSIDWSTVGAPAGGMLVLLAVWLKFYLVPRRPKEWMAAELVFLVVLMVLLSNLAAVMQYGAVALGTPYVDHWLAAADEALGIYVPSLAAWTTAHPKIDLLLMVSYATLLVQFFVVIGLLGAYRDRAHLWEFAFHYHVCLIITVAALVIFPAACAPEYYGFRPTIDATRYIAQIRGFHTGTMTVVRFDQIDGLVSFPSFHVAGALVATWAVRHRRWVFVPIAALNVALIASTVFSGVHYAVDAIGAVPLFAFSVFIYRRWFSRLLPSQPTDDITDPQWAPCSPIAESSSPPLRTRRPWRAKPVSAQDLILCVPGVRGGEWTR